MVFGVAVACASVVIASSPVMAAERARPADGLVDTMGINVHAAFGSYVTDWQRVIDAVGDIGFRYVRDISWRADRLNALTAATGAKLDVIVQYGWQVDAIDPVNFDAEWSRVQTLNNVAYLELPNEPEYFPNWASNVNSWGARLYQSAKANPAFANVPLIGSVVYDGAAIADVNAYLDYGNVHSYTAGYKPLNRLDINLSVAQRLTGDKPVIATETGYNNGYLNTTNTPAPGVTERATATYLPRLYLDYFNAGIIKTLNYEMVDSYTDPTFTLQESHFGLLRSDFSYKPAAHALKNLIALLKDPGPEFHAASLEYTLAGPGNTADLHHTLLQKRDGTFWLALWQDMLSYDPATRQDLVFPSLDVTLDLGIPVVTATTYRPNDSIAPTATTAATDHLTVGVDDRVILLALQLARPGDTDADGDVDAADLRTFLGNFGHTGRWQDGDFNRNGMVDFSDFQLLERNFGGDFTPAQQEEILSTGMSVPEPGAALVLLPALAMLNRCRLRFRRMPSP